ncbi:glucose dehydrogenase [Klebsiella pneumoniae]|uniref:Glucose dehydrogenase n=1 Tax=Klebsiella pneumoniae TaxID=573 RepID=A0A377XDN1_KLEPN|nr:glucose dehydrogenase [Klebsiella pneumoniae]
MWLRRLHGNWQRAARIPPDPAVASRRTDAHHRSGCGYSWGKTGPRRRYTVLRADGRGHVIAAVLIFRNRRGGILLYAVAFIASVIWAISDAGWNYWPLFSRLFALGVLAFLAALVWPFLASPPAKKGPAYGVAAVLAVALAVSFGWMFKSAPLVSATEAVPVKPVAQANSRKTGRTGVTPPRRPFRRPRPNQQTKRQPAAGCLGSAYWRYPTEQRLGRRRSEHPRCRLAILSMSVPLTVKCWRWMWTAEKRNGAMTPNPLHPTGSAAAA